MDRLTLRERASEILNTAILLSEELSRGGFSEPSFEHGLPSPMRDNAPASKAGAVGQDLLLKLDEFRALVTEPSLLLTPELRNPTLSVQPIIRLGIGENFPPHGCEVKDLAAKLNLRDGLVRRLLAHSATHHIYYEASPDHFVHTAASRVLAENEGMRKWFLLGSQELLPATLKTADALVKNPNSEEPEHCGWTAQNNTNLPIFRAFANMPDRVKIFAEAMTYHAMLPGYSTQSLVDEFPWGTGEELTVIDIGGSLGHISMALASHSPTVRCIVEDSEEVVAQGRQGLPAEFQDRISFRAHDVFNEQPVQGADVYLLRLVLHDWSNKYATMILKALVPALKKGAKVLINDRVIPGYHEMPYLKEREARDYDLYMLAFQNAQERTPEDWKMLLRGADLRFRLSCLVQPPRSLLAIIEVTWDD